MLFLSSCCERPDGLDLAKESYTEAEIRGLIAAKQAKNLSDSILVKDTLFERYLPFVLVDSFVYRPVFFIQGKETVYTLIARSRESI